MTAAGTSRGTAKTAKTIKPAGKPASKPAGRWSARVSRESRALDLEEGVFTWDDPGQIAASLKRSAEESMRRNAEPYRSALSMLAFYINRAGTNLPEPRRRILEKAKLELKKAFHRELHPAAVRQRHAKSPARSA